MPTAFEEHPSVADPSPDDEGTLTVPPQVREDVTAGPAERSGPTVVVLDPVALQVARAAAEAEAGRPEQIGEFLVAVAEDEIAITAQFAAAQPGYLGWHWSVTLAVISESHPTVSEVVLLPGEVSLLAPAWIPWEERIRPGDVGIGDLLPLIADDPRVVPAYLQSDDPAVEDVAHELGIGRVRVLSREGRVDFAERLHDGSFGSSDGVALAAPAHCLTCAFYLPLAGSLGRLMGACGNEFSPADGRVVDVDYGCGAHSETVIDMPARSAATEILIDELSLEVHRRPAAAVSINADAEDAPIDDEVLAVDLEMLDEEVLDLAVLDAEILDADMLDPAELRDAAALDAENLDADLLDPDELREVAALDADDLDVDPLDGAGIESIDAVVVDVDATDLDLLGADTGDLPDIEA